MRIASRGISLTALVVLTACFSPPTMAQETKPNPTPPAAPAATAPQPVGKFKLVLKAEKGQVRKSKSAVSLKANVGGEDTAFEQSSSGKRTYTDIATNGDITFETVTEESKMTIDGETVPDDPDDKPSVDTYTIRPNGMLVKFKTSDTEPDNTHMEERMYYATAPVFPDKEIGVGDKWTQEYAADTAMGLRGGKAEFEVVGVEKSGTADAVRIKMSYTESGDKGIISKANLLIEKATGDVLVAEVNFERLPVGSATMPAIATGTLTGRRTEGGPLAGSQNVAGPAVAEKPKEKTIDETVKDYEKLPGLFTIYRKRELNKDQMYMEVREDQFNKVLLLQATASTGDGNNLIAGDMISDTLFTLTKGQDDKVLLTVPNWHWRSDPNTPLGRAVQRSFPDAYLLSFRVEAKQADRKSVLIDVSDFFRSDFAQITLSLQGQGLPTLTGMPISGFMLDREKTYINKVRNFPDNLVVQTNYHFFRGGRPSAGGALADSRSLPLGVVFNLIPLPNDPITFASTNGYRPRTADPRIGYFTDEMTDLRDDGKEDMTVRYITRWDLRKKDPNAAVSEPVKPIVFWLDNAIPVEYRAAIKKGILSWNKAFEKVGFKNAVVVEQQPDKADWDHADMRYNMVRWVVTPPGSNRNGVAVGQYRENPLTGQILNGSITIDAEWARFGKIERRKLVDPAVAYRNAAGTDYDLLFNTPMSLPADVQAKVNALKAEYIRRGNGNPNHCQVADAMEMNAHMGLLALRAIVPLGSAAREKAFTDQMLTEVAAHEMGHILGLRHNFIGSAYLTLDQLKDPKVVGQQGIGASVMDYNAFNLSAIRAGDVDFFSQTVGVYDDWVIRYGYAPFTPTEEPARLKRIASESNQPGHAYHSDETLMVRLDPRVVQGDISADPLLYWERVMGLSRYLLVNLDKTSPKPGESYYEFTLDFQMLLATYASAAGQVSRYVGGYYLNRNHKGDPNEKPTTEPVDAERQQRALTLLNTYVFSPDAFNLPERYYSHLTTDPNGLTFSADFPVGDQISGIQRNALQGVFSPATLRRIANSEFKKGGDPSKTLTLPVVFRDVTTNVWAEVGTRKNIPTLRRQLHRAWIDTMVGMVTGGGPAPEDARMLAWEQLKQVRTRLAAAQNYAGYDDYTRIHIADCLTRVDRVLKAGYTYTASSGGGGMNLLQMLFGNETP